MKIVENWFLSNPLQLLRMRISTSLKVSFQLLSFLKSVRKLFFYPFILLSQYIVSTKDGMKYANLLGNKYSLYSRKLTSNVGAPHFKSMI